MTRRTEDRSPIFGEHQHILISKEREREQDFKLYRSITRTWSAANREGRDWCIALGGINDGYVEHPRITELRTNKPCQYAGTEGVYLPGSFKWFASKILAEAWLEGDPAADAVRPLTRPQRGVRPARAVHADELWYLGELIWLVGLTNIGPSEMKYVTNAYEPWTVTSKGGVYPTLGRTYEDAASTCRDVKASMPFREPQVVIIVDDLELLEEKYRSETAKKPKKGR